MMIKSKIDALKSVVLHAELRIDELLSANESLAAAKAELEAAKAALEAQVADLQTKVVDADNQAALDSVDQFILDNPVK